MDQKNIDQDIAAFKASVVELAELLYLMALHGGPEEIDKAVNAIRGKAVRLADIHRELATH